MQRIQETAWPIFSKYFESFILSFTYNPNKNPFLGFLMGWVFIREVIGLGKKVGWEASQAHFPLFLTITLLQLVITRLSSLWKYHTGVVNFMLVFSPGNLFFFLKNPDICVDYFYYKDSYWLLNAETFLIWAFLRRGDLPTILNKA